jgi:hypothetical protein
MPSFCLVDVTQEEAHAGGVLTGKIYTDIAGVLERYQYKALHFSVWVFLLLGRRVYLALLTMECQNTYTIAYH